MVPAMKHGRVAGLSSDGVQLPTWQARSSHLPTLIEPPGSASRALCRTYAETKNAGFKMAHRMPLSLTPHSIST